MDELAGEIKELEVKAAESALIADLSTNREIRTYNARLARDLREAADGLRLRAKKAGIISADAPALTGPAAFTACATSSAAGAILPSRPS